MRTYDDLTVDEQKEAREHALTDLLRAILEQGLRFDDEANGDHLQERIDKALAEAERMQTPWFAHEYIMDTCREDLEGMATADAETAKYPDADERTIRLG